LREDDELERDLLVGEPEAAEVVDKVLGPVVGRDRRVLKKARDPVFVKP
jgi:hypothetical protein